MIHEGHPLDPRLQGDEGGLATPVGPRKRAFSRETQGAKAGAGVRLSIIMPVLNEADTVLHAIAALLRVDFPCPIEIIVLDDGSTDGTPEMLAELKNPLVRVHRHPVNRGKGAALRTAAEIATGTHLVPFDADLEYTASDLLRVLEPVISGNYDVVYGTRIFGVNTVYQSYRYALGNRVPTLAANILFDANVTDLHTCLKLIPIELFRSFRFQEQGFGLDTEVTALLLRLGIRPFEVPVSYHSRTHAQGKKVSWRDGVTCLRILARVRFSCGALKTPAVVALATGLRSGPAIDARPPRAPRPDGQLTSVEGGYDGASLVVAAGPGER